jgi:Domain of unknown function (DUF397)
MSHKPEPTELARAQWRKSVRSNGGDNCVEVAFLGDGVAVRDSKNPTDGNLLFTRGEWEAFIGGAKDGEFDLI